MFISLFGQLVRHWQLYFKGAFNSSPSLLSSFFSSNPLKHTQTALATLLSPIVTTNKQVTILCLRATQCTILSEDSGLGNWMLRPRSKQLKSLPSPTLATYWNVALHSCNYQIQGAAKHSFGISCMSIAHHLPNFRTRGFSVRGWVNKNHGWFTSRHRQWLVKT